MIVTLGDKMIKTQVTIESGKITFQDALEQAKRDEGVVEMGIFEGSTYPDGMSVAQVAFYHEFGTKNIASRSFLRSTEREQQSAWLALYTSQIQAKPEDKNAGRNALTAVGLRGVNDIKAKINSNIPPALAESTKKAKLRSKLTPPKDAKPFSKSYKALIQESATPELALVDTGVLFDSLEFEVFDHDRD